VPTTPAPTTPAPATPATPTPGTTSPEAAPTTPSAPTPFEVVVEALVPAQYHPQVAAVERALGPLRAFLVEHARPADRETFTSLAATLGNEARGDELWVLAPAFIATELREAFMIAILIFVPFLVIDLVVALGLAS